MLTWEWLTYVNLHFLQQKLWKKNGMHSPRSSWGRYALSSVLLLAWIYFGSTNPKEATATWGQRETAVWALTKYDAFVQSVADSIDGSGPGGMPQASWVNRCSSLQAVLEKKQLKYFRGTQHAQSKGLHFVWCEDNKCSFAQEKRRLPMITPHLPFVA